MKTRACLSVVCIAISTVAQAQGMDPAEWTIEKQRRVLCGEVFRGAAWDLLEEGDNGIPAGQYVHECIHDFEAPTISGEISGSADTDPVAPVGAALIEASNKWGLYRAPADDVLQISVRNPYDAPLRGVRFTQAPGSCDGSAPVQSYRLDFVSPIAPRSSEFVEAAFPDYRGNPDGWSCLTVTDAVPDHRGDGSRNRASALLQAGAFLEAGLEVDRLRATSRAGEEAVASVVNDLEPVVRSLPASDAIANYNGYLVLEALRPGNSDYAQRKTRYRQASRQDRLTSLMEMAGAAAGVVSLDHAANGLSDNRTRAQRQDTWEEIEGRQLEVTGSVTDVRPDGLLSNARILMDLRDGLNASCEVEAFLNDAAVGNIDVGDRVTCSGELFNYTILLGELTLSLTDASFEK